MRTKKMKSQIKEAKTAWAMLTPALVVLALIQGYPILRTFWLSFHEINLKRPQSGFPWIGISNYAKILYLIFDYPHKHYTFKYFEV